MNYIILICLNICKVSSYIKEIVFTLRKLLLTCISSQLYDLIYDRSSEDFENDLYISSCSEIDRSIFHYTL